MSITEEQIKALTPEHRIVWHRPPGQPVEMGLYVDEDGALHTDAGYAVRWEDGMVALGALDCIVRIIPPAFAPRKGLVIGHPELAGRRLAHMDTSSGSRWLGYAPEIYGGEDHWFTDDEARTLVESHGWEVIEDLAAPGEVTDEQVEAAAKALAAHFGAGADEWPAWANEARAVLEAAREVSGE